jgi:hypothetical protein
MLSTRQDREHARGGPVRRALRPQMTVTHHEGRSILDNFGKTITASTKGVVTGTQAIVGTADADRGPNREALEELYLTQRLVQELAKRVKKDS